jgi:hypothetical protein
MRYMRWKVHEVYTVEAVENAIMVSEVHIDKVERPLPLSPLGASFWPVRHFVCGGCVMVALQRLPLASLTSPAPLAPMASSESSATALVSNTNPSVVLNTNSSLLPFLHLKSSTD